MIAESSAGQHYVLTVTVKKCHTGDVLTTYLKRKKYIFALFIFL